MGKLTIVDLDFCESEFFRKSKEKGGVSSSSTSSSYSISNNLDNYPRRRWRVKRSQLSGIFGSAGASAIAIGNVTYVETSVVVPTN